MFFVTVAVVVTITTWCSTVVDGQCDYGRSLYCPGIDPALISTTETPVLIISLVVTLLRKV